jgi:hypothetical protein
MPVQCFLVLAAQPQSCALKTFRLHHAVSAYEVNEHKRCVPCAGGHVLAERKISKELKVLGWAVALPNAFLSTF